MAKPTPDGREWLTPLEIAGRIEARLRQTGRVDESVRTEVRNEIAEAYADIGYDTEFKIVRLTERLKDALLAGAFGLLGTRDEPTDVGRVYYEGLKPIFTKHVLDSVDENGNLKEGTDE